MTKKRSPKEIIESNSSPKLEQSYLKFPGQEMTYVAKNPKEKSVELDSRKARKLWGGNKGKSWTHIHTHPYHEKGQSTSQERYNSLPSPNDVRNFLLEDKEKRMIIAQVDPEDGMLYGYFIFRKTKQTPKFGHTRIPSLLERLKSLFIETPVSKELMDAVNDYNISYQRGTFENYYPSAEGGIERLADKFHLQYRFVPGSKKEVYTHRMKKKSKILVFVSISSLLLATFFFNSSITGNVISNLTIKNSSLIGAGLFLIGIASALFYFRVKKY